MEKLGKEMTRKCGGLPLAVLILAGILRTKHTLKDWEDLNETFSSILKDQAGPAHYKKSVYQTLMLSYHDLPDYLKPCFLYLAQFPEDYEIKSKKLIQMWIAEGFVLAADENSLEEVARQYLNELICRCMAQVVERSSVSAKAKSIRLHDVTREFCITKAKNEWFLEVFPPNSQSAGTTSTTNSLRRVSLLSSETFRPIQHSYIRSFIQFGVKGSTTDSLQAVQKNHKLLRVLILYGVETHDGYLPEKLGNLRHLRHLALVNTNIKTLPKSIENLSNLLYLEYTVKLGTEWEALPNVLWKTQLLRHLYLDEAFKFPEGLNLHALTNLQTLWAIQGTHEEEMKRLSPSLQKLGILGIESQRLLDVVFQSPCVTSGNLVNVKLQWSEGVQVKLQSMEALYRHLQHVRKLMFWGEIREDCPLRFLPNLAKLQLRNSKLHQDPMVAAGGLSHLKYLSLQDDAYMGATISCGGNSFPQLEELHITNLYNLEEWTIEKDAMPLLKKLMISNCRKLKMLPKKLKFVHTLQQLKIWYMPRTFCDRLFRGSNRANNYRVGEEDGGERGEDFHIIEHIPDVLFRIEDSE